jgi:hypothetical protein
MFLVNIDPGMIEIPKSTLNNGDVFRALAFSLDKLVEAVNDNKAVIVVSNDLYLEYLDAIYANPGGYFENRTYYELFGKLLQRVEFVESVGQENNETEVDPNILSDWVSPEILAKWKKALQYSIMQTRETSKESPIVSTWSREGIPDKITVRDKTSQLSPTNIPVASDDCQWETLLQNLNKWPNGIQSSRIDLYASCFLKLSKDELNSRKRISFTPSCLKEIASITEESIQQLVVQVISCLAFNRLPSKNKLERLRGKKGIHRLWVKKRAPDIRFHLEIAKDKFLFTNYYFQDHDKGLR